MKIKKMQIPVAGVREDYETPGPVTTWSQMSPEKKAELRALYENRPAKPNIGLSAPDDTPRKKKFYRKYTQKKAQLTLTIVK